MNPPLSFSRNGYWHLHWWAGILLLERTYERIEGVRCVVFLAVCHIPLEDARPGRTHGLPDTQGLVTPAAYSATRPRT